MLEKVADYGSTWSIRTWSVVRNIGFSLLFKGISIFATLLLVPLSIQYLNAEKYGIWLTFGSLTAWVTFFDIGIGNGLRNKLAAAIARDDIYEGRQLVSTAYGIVGILSVSLLILFWSVFPLITWSTLLSMPTEFESELKQVALIVFSFFFFQLWFSLINSVLNATQQNSRISLIVFIINVGTLVAVYLSTLFIKPSLWTYGLAQNLVTFSAYMAFNWILFVTKLRSIRPSIKFFNITKIREILNLGLIFFVLQIAAVLLYQTNNIVIARWFGTNEVTNYNISFRYFSVVTMFFSIIAAPLWSSFTDAYIKQDYLWIQATIRRLLQFWLVLQVVLLLMVLMGDWIYTRWVGNSIIISFNLTIANAIYVSILSWNTIFVGFLNGVSKIRLQFYLTILCVIVFFPLTYALSVTMKMGIEGVVCGNCICQVIFAIITPIQYRKLISNSAKGLWNL